MIRQEKPADAWISAAIGTVVSNALLFGLAIVVVIPS
jgi:hypothetical protein